MPNSVLTIGDTRYHVRGSSLRQELADGTAGPIVGSVDADGCITIDEEASAGEWVAELLTARVPAGEPVAVPPSLRDGLSSGRAVEWPGALPSELVSACRAELEALGKRRLSNANHGQAPATRGDRVAFLAFGQEGVGGGDDDDESSSDEDEQSCPPRLAEAYRWLESVGSQLGRERVLGCSMLVPRLGMAAVYDGGAPGYVCHRDNERAPRDDVDGDAGRLGRWRNARVLTAIAYLNDEDWRADDGGRLRCYARDDGYGDGACVLEVVPRGGTVVLFPSCAVPHEVEASRGRPRYAISLWFVSGSLVDDGDEADGPRGNRSRKRVRQDGPSSASAEPTALAAPAAAARAGEEPDANGGSSLFNADRSGSAGRAAAGSGAGSARAVGAASAAAQPAASFLPADADEAVSFSFGFGD